MKQALLLTALLFSSMFLLAEPIDTKVSIRNTHFSYVNRGMCSVAFDVTAYDFIENVKEIEFKVLIKDKKGRLLDLATVTADEFNRVGGKAYSQFFLEGEEACGFSGETLEVVKAVVIYNDYTPSEDIIETNKLEIQEFNPMKIVIKK